MLGVGLNFQKGKFRVSVLERAPAGTIGYNTHRSVTVDPVLPIPELMERYASQFRLLFDEFQPGLVAARHVWDGGNVDAANCQIAPFGIAAYVCNEKSISFFHYTPQALRQPTPFGLPKGVNPISAVDQTFGVNPPYWDDMQRGSVLAVWRALREQ